MLEKFWLTSESKDWGKGVGRSGSVGTVGNACSLAGIVVVAVVEATDVADEAAVEEKTIVAVDPLTTDVSTTVCSASCGCLLCRRQSVPFVDKVCQLSGSDSEKISNATGCVM